MAKTTGRDDQLTAGVCVGNRVNDMTYAAIMVHLDAEVDSSNRLGIAVDLANRFHAALIGIVGLSPGMGYAADVAVIDADPAKTQEKEMDALLAARRNAFCAAARDIDRMDFRGQLQIPLNAVVEESRSADIVIMGRQAPPERHFLTVDPGVAILRMGRPVLAVPDNVSSLAARRVAIAWKDVREARRAVRDALPLLKGAHQVFIAEVSERGAEPETKRGLDDVGNYLRGHGIAVAAEAFLRPGGTVADELMRFTEEQKADLLVAGAYGHSRLGEWAFGGVTRDLLARSRVCCLWSH
jgi:nucleotide-binding universal stress UspA family protein